MPVEPHRAGPPRPCAALASRIVCSPKWKIEAASTALAWPSRTPSTRWSSVPTPPEAMTGTRHRVGDGAGQREVVAGLGAVAVHRGQQDLAGAELARPPAAKATASMPVGLRPPWVKISQRSASPAPETCLASMATTMHWLPNFSAARRTNCAVVHRGGVDRDLVGAGQQQRADVLDRAHAAADGQRHEAGSAVRVDDVEQRAAVLVARGDVEEAELVGAGGVVGAGALDRIAGVAQVDEVDALDDAAVLDVEAGDDADLKHGRPPFAARRARSAPAPAAGSSRPS